MLTYTVGDKVRVTATFTGLDGTATSPTTVTFKVRDPELSISTYVYGTATEVVLSTTGIFYVDVSLTTSGEWRYRWAGSGTVQAADEGPIFVDESSF